MLATELTPEVERWWMSWAQRVHDEALEQAPEELDRLVVAVATASRLDELG